MSHDYAFITGVVLIYFVLLTFISSNNVSDIKLKPKVSDVTKITPSFTI
jgi:hypothetical protein